MEGVGDGAEQFTVGGGFAGELGVAVFVKGHDGAGGEVMEAGLECGVGGVVDVHVEVEQGDLLSGVFAEECGQGFCDVALDEGVFLYVGERGVVAVGVEQLAQELFVLFGYRELPVGHVAGSGVGVPGSLEALKGVETEDAPAVVVGFKHGAQGLECDEVTTPPNTALQDGPRDVQDVAIDFLEHEEAGQLLTAQEAVEVGDPIGRGDGAAVVEGVDGLVALLFPGGPAALVGGVHGEIFYHGAWKAWLFLVGTVPI